MHWLVLLITLNVWTICLAGNRTSYNTS
jgi:hypothetical protein